MALAQPVRVVVADDHPPTRAAVRDALERGGFIVCGEACDAGSAIAAVDETDPDIALLDIRMPGSGIVAAATITAHRPKTSIVMLTVSQDDDDLFGALRAGASGYLLKGMDPIQLPVALEQVTAGEAVLPGTLLTRLVAEFRARDRRHFLVGSSHRAGRLTPREWEVLEQFEKGLSTGEVAERLYIAKVTVRSHAAAILHKLQVPDREAAVRLLRQGRG